MHLKERKYDTWEWTYGRSPRFTFHNKRKWPGHSEVIFKGKMQVITVDLRFMGDFLTSLDEVENALRALSSGRIEVQSCPEASCWSGILVRSLCQRF